MARFARDRSLVEALVAGVTEMQSVHATEGQYDSHDLLNWLNINRNPELNALYDLYLDCDDPQMRANHQIGKFLDRLGQIKIGELPSERHAILEHGVNRFAGGDCEVSVWEISASTRTSLTAERALLFGPGGFFDRIAAEPLPVPTTGTAADWIERISGTFKDDPDFEEFVEHGRAYRNSIGSTDPGER